MSAGYADVFPANELRASGGEICAHILENRRSNFPRQLWWDVRLEFEPVRYGEGDFSASLSCDSIRWAFRDWRSLVGATFEKDDPERGGWAGTFHTGEHSPAHSIRLRIDTRSLHRFRVSLETSVDLPESDCFDRKHESRIVASAEIPYVGLYVVPGNLFPKPTTPADVHDVAAEFVDPCLYRAAEPWLDHAFIFRPRAGP